jgi:isoleucyl-tRNA synthetase
MLAPVLAFTCDEVWTYVPDSVKKVNSVHLSEWPAVNQKYINPEIDENWNKILKIRTEVSKALEKARNEKLIGNSLEAKVELYVGDATKMFLEKHAGILAQVMIVSSVDIRAIEQAPAEAFKSELINSLAIGVSPASGAKCERCWRFEETVGVNAEHPGLCARCNEVVTR